MLATKQLNNLNKPQYGGDQKALQPLKLDDVKTNSCYKKNFENKLYPQKSQIYLFEHTTLMLTFAKQTLFQSKSRNNSSWPSPKNALTRFAEAAARRTPIRHQRTTPAPNRHSTHRSPLPTLWPPPRCDTICPPFGGATFIWWTKSIMSRTPWARMANSSCSFVWVWGGFWISFCKLDEWLNLSVIFAILLGNICCIVCWDRWPPLEPPRTCTKSRVLCANVVCSPSCARFSSRWTNSTLSWRIPLHREYRRSANYRV